jgi:signal transduction histidine kinase
VRRQLGLLALATTSLVVLAFLLPLALLLRTLAEDRAVASFVQEAQAVAVVVAVVGDSTQLEPVVQLVGERSGRAMTVFLPDGSQVGSPADPASRSRALADVGRSFNADVDGGREVLVPVDTARGRAVVRTLVPDEELHRGVGSALAVLGALAVALLAVAVLVADRLARGTVGPVAALAATTHRLAGGDLSARVEPGGPPEVREVGAAVNALGARIGELLEAERNTVADLSHRLRTPLTALRLNAEGLRDPAEASRLTDDVDALERAVDEVIRDARRQVREGPEAECDASAVVAERVRFWGALAEDQRRPWALVADDGPHRVRLPCDDLSAALDALLGNVFAHTPDGTAVEVRLDAGPDAVRVSVGDRGPGLPGTAVERGTSGGGSTGLGLDIARRTAEASGGRLEVTRRPGGGAIVSLALGTPPGARRARPERS